MAERVPGAHERPVEFDEPALGRWCNQGCRRVIEDQEGKGSRPCWDLCQPIPELVNYPDLKDGPPTIPPRTPQREMTSGSTATFGGDPLPLSDDPPATLIPPQARSYHHPTHCAHLLPIILGDISEVRPDPRGGSRFSMQPAVRPAPRTRRPCPARDSCFRSSMPARPRAPARRDPGRFQCRRCLSLHRRSR